MPCSKTSFLKLPSIHRFRCLVLSEIFTHLSLVWIKTYSLSGEQNLWTFDQPTFVPVFLSVRYDPLSSYVYYVSIALCLPPPPQILRRLFFSNPLGRTEIPKRIWKQYLMHLFLIILLYGALLPWDFFGRAQTRVLESKIPPTCLHQQDRTMIKRCEEIIYCYSVILLSLLKIWKANVEIIYSLVLTSLSR